MKRVIQLAASCLILASVAAAHDTAPDTVAPEIIGAIVPAIQKCWNLPKLPDGERPHVSLKVHFNDDGTTRGEPQILSKADGPNGEAFTASTVRAIQKCQPYEVLLKHPYERWREIIINFDL